MKTGRNYALERIEECRRTKSEFLNLSNLRLTEVSEEVCELEWLTSLDLSHNEIQDASFLEKLTGLTSLNLCWNGIQNVTFLEKPALTHVPGRS
jgi:Leucine-rich repeat (LRR) protein